MVGKFLKFSTPKYDFRLLRTFFAINIEAYNFRNKVAFFQYIK